MMNVNQGHQLHYPQTVLLPNHAFNARPSLVPGDYMAQNVRSIHHHGTREAQAFHPVQFPTQVPGGKAGGGFQVAQAQALPGPQPVVSDVMPRPPMYINMPMPGQGPGKGITPANFSYSQKCYQPSVNASFPPSFARMSLSMNTPHQNSFRPQGSIQMISSFSSMPRLSHPQMMNQTHGIVGTVVPPPSVSMTMPSQITYNIPHGLNSSYTESTLVNPSLSNASQADRSQEQPATAISKNNRAQSSVLQGTNQCSDYPVNTESCDYYSSNTYHSNKGLMEEGTERPGSNEVFKTDLQTVPMIDDPENKRSLDEKNGTENDYDSELLVVSDLNDNGISDNIYNEASNERLMPKCDINVQQDKSYFEPKAKLDNPSMISANQNLQEGHSLSSFSCENSQITRSSPQSIQTSFLASDHYQKQSSYSTSSVPATYDTQSHTHLLYGYENLQNLTAENSSVNLQNHNQNPPTNIGDTNQNAAPPFVPVVQPCSDIPDLRQEFLQKQMLPLPGQLVVLPPLSADRSIQTLQLLTPTQEGQYSVQTIVLPIIKLPTSVPDYSTVQKPYTAVSKPYNASQNLEEKPVDSPIQPSEHSDCPETNGTESNDPLLFNCEDDGVMLNQVDETGLPRVMQGIHLDRVKEFAAEFKSIRLKLGLTQTQVGMALQTSAGEGTVVSQSTICRFEKLEITALQVKRLLPILQSWLSKVKEKQSKGIPIDLDSVLQTTEGKEVKKRKKRTVFSDETVAALNVEFAKDQNPCNSRLTEIATLVGLEKETVRVWFSNRRQTERKLNKE